MHRHNHAGEILKAFREQLSLSQKQLAIKTQLVDDREDRDVGGISVSILSQIEHGERLLSAKYLKLINATGVFSQKQTERLYTQAAIDLIRRQFGSELSRFLVNDTLEVRSLDA